VTPKTAQAPGALSRVADGRRRRAMAPMNIIPGTNIAYSAGSGIASTDE
jgi:hypothetical protein